MPDTEHERQVAELEELGKRFNDAALDAYNRASDEDKPKILAALRDEPERFRIVD